MKGVKLAPQSYGIAMAQVTFGGPRGVWLGETKQFKWRAFTAGDVAPFFPHGTRVDVRTPDGFLPDMHPAHVNWGYDSSVTAFRLRSLPSGESGV